MLNGVVLSISNLYYQATCEAAMDENIKNFVLACKKDESLFSMKAHVSTEDGAYKETSIFYILLSTTSYPRRWSPKRAGFRSLERISDSKPEFHRAPLVNATKPHLINATHI